MNKRIQELVTATDAWCDQNLPSNWTDDVDKYLPVWNEKFAELIVRGCLSQVDKVDAMLDAMHEGEKGKIGVAMVGAAITRHFYFGHGSVVEFS